MGLRRDDKVAAILKSATGGHASSSHEKQKAMTLMEPSGNRDMVTSNCGSTKADRPRDTEASCRALAQRNGGTEKVCNGRGLRREGVEEGGWSEEDMSQGGRRSQGFQRIRTVK